MKKIIKLIEATGKLPPHVTDMLSQAIPWVSVTIIVAAVLYFTNR